MPGTQTAKMRAFFYERLNFRNRLWIKYIVRAVRSGCRPSSLIFPAGKNLELEDKNGAAADAADNLMNVFLCIVV